MMQCYRPFQSQFHLRYQSEEGVLCCMLARLISCEMFLCKFEFYWFEFGNVQVGRAIPCIQVYIHTVHTGHRFKLYYIFPRDKSMLYKRLCGYSSQSTSHKPHKWGFHRLTMLTAHLTEIHIHPFMAQEWRHSLNERCCVWRYNVEHEHEWALIWLWVSWGSIKYPTAQDTLNKWYTLFVLL